MDGQKHLFEDDSYDLSLSQWYTPPALANKMVQWALRGRNASLSILEPSAGAGALIAAIPRNHQVTAVEIDARRIDALKAFPHVVEVRQEDYLSTPLRGRFDLAIMNPPYEGGMDVAFISAALSQCWRVVAILRSAALHGVERWVSTWSKVDICRIAILTSRPRFSGTEGSPLSDFIVVEMRCHDGHRVDLGVVRTIHVEWW